MYKKGLNSLVQQEGVPENKGLVSAENAELLSFDKKKRKRVKNFIQLSVRNRKK